MGWGMTILISIIITLSLVIVMDVISGRIKLGWNWKREKRNSPNE